jgi:hypothetical protein
MPFGAAPPDREPARVRLRKLTKNLQESRSWSWSFYKDAKNLVGLLSVVVAALVAASGYAQMDMLDRLPDWAGAASVFLGVGLLCFTAVMLLVAPQVLWQRERERAEKAELELVPAIEVEPTIRTPQGEYHPLACLFVRNTRQGSIEDCEGEVVAAYAVIGRERVPLEGPPFLLRWAITHTADPHNPKHSFAKSAILEVAVAECTWGRCSLRLLSFRPKRIVAARQESGDHFLPEHTRYVLDIEVSARNTASVRKEYHVEVRFPEDRGKPSGGGGWTGGQPAELLAFEEFSQRPKTRTQTSHFSHSGGSVPDSRPGGEDDGGGTERQRTQGGGGAMG